MGFPWCGGTRVPSARLRTQISDCKQHLGGFIQNRTNRNRADAAIIYKINLWFYSPKVQVNP